MASRFLLAVVAACSLGASPCVGEDVNVDLGPPDLAPRVDLAMPDLAPPGDLTVLPDLLGYQAPPDPFQPGTPRLGIGAFYEGGASETVAIDNTTSHLYIYPSGNTLTVSDDKDVKAEGYVSQRCQVSGGLGWFGMGVHWDAARDLTKWRTLHIALRSSAATMNDVVIGMNSPMQNPETAKLNAKNYGYTNDGAFHHLAIPLSDFAGVSPGALKATQVMAPLVLLNAGLVKDGDLLWVDDVYFE